MSKRTHSPDILPEAKRAHGLESSSRHYISPRSFNALYDEVILVIFSYLSYNDLCAVQSVNRDWARLTLDNQLWKSLYLTEYGRTRLRGVRGFIGRSDGRETKPLPGRARHELPDDFRDWRWMFRISSNWRTGRCSVETLQPGLDAPPLIEPEIRGNHVLLAGSVTIATVVGCTVHPELLLASPLHGTHNISCQTPRSQANTIITALALDQAPPPNAHDVLLAAFLSTGEFVILSINHHRPTQSVRQLTYLPTANVPRTTPIIQAAFHGRLLATLSQSFHLSLYDLSSGTIVHKQTLSSFTSYPPSSLVLTPAGSSTYRLIIAYAIPVFPAHWSVGATELIITASIVVSSSRSIRAYDVPSGWIDEHKLRLVREQWGRRVARVSDTQTDGKWVVLAPGDPPPRSTPESGDDSASDSASSSASSFVASRLHSPSSLQLYRLYLPTAGSSQPRLSYVRSLHGQIGPVTALALADGRCVSLAANGSIWAWDLEAGTGAEVFAGIGPFDEDGGLDLPGRHLGKGHVVFDERRIVSADARGVEVRRFDI
ncbi:hypothetical protein PHLGIDRAFT_104517 [Phlebiopsis gigantea 11061_1 CR5-6]|uniref:F-box domain-containing protein n=1 Tax=Phlebiopsis gigantea (strain 11061_1 CR5-6) TaxID=745531 RepID=A0A0C3PNA2_PHLG1|nr:hypothetical protein PHLGIDRAFT_104517 [Phlebiopsis gigantea 11061_1 CR5-6]